MYFKILTMAKIQAEDWLYNISKIFADHHLRRSFKRYRVIGRENIPKDGACIFASNHCSALVDAMSIIASSRGSKVFLSRSDIFQNPMVAKILNWMKILPIYRMRDGIQSVRDKNGAIMEQAVDVIYDEVPLCLFPEATHRAKHSLRHLSKGVFHIALKANSSFGDEKPVYIVPVGLEYGDYFRFRSTALVSFGTPLNVTEYMKAHEGENEAVIMNDLKAILTQKIANLISYVPDNEDYDAIWELTKIKSARRSADLVERLAKNKENISKILEFKEKEPKKAQELFRKVEEFTKKRRQKAISVLSIAKKTTFWNVLLKTFMVLLGLPLFVASAVVTSPIWIVSYLFLRNQEDEAFTNTVNIGVEMALHPLIMVVGVTLLFCLAPWEFSLLGSVFLYFSYVYFVDYKEYFRVWLSDLRWIFSKNLRNEDFLTLFAVN